MVSQLCAKSSWTENTQKAHIWVNRSGTKYVVSFREWIQLRKFPPNITHMGHQWFALRLMHIWIKQLYVGNYVKRIQMRHTRILGSTSSNFGLPLFNSWINSNFLYLILYWFSHNEISHLSQQQIAEYAVTLNNLMWWHSWDCWLKHSLAQRTEISDTNKCPVETEHDILQTLCEIML